VDSGGANLPNQDEVFPDRDHFGRIFFNQANMSAKGIAQIAVVMGSCTAGGAYVPAMSDETIIVQGAGHDLSRRPAAGEGGDRRGVSAEDLGGGDVHTRLSGVADHLADNDAHALELARQIVANLNGRERVDSAAGLTPEDPLYDPGNRWASFPPTPRQPYDIREVIARIVDGSRFDEFKARYGTTLVCGFAHVTACRSASSPTTACCFPKAR
jgi:3-methylcrotonyl-CoA carboxylase beta subunit